MAEARNVLIEGWRVLRGAIFDPLSGAQQGLDALIVHGSGFGAAKNLVISPARRGRKYFAGWIAICRRAGEGMPDRQAAGIHLYRARNCRKSLTSRV